MPTPKLIGFGRASKHQRRTQNARSQSTVVGRTSKGVRVRKDRWLRALCVPVALSKTNDTMKNKVIEGILTGGFVNAQIFLISLLFTRNPIYHYVTLLVTPFVLALITGVFDKEA